MAQSTFEALWVKKVLNEFSTVVETLANLSFDRLATTDKREVLYLKSSIARSLKQPEQSARFWEEALSTAVDLNQSEFSLGFEFESGLHHYLKSQYFEAYERFYRVYKSVSLVDLKIISLGNCLLCQENLALETAKTILEIEDLLRLASPAIREYYKNLKLGFDLRAAATTGSFSSVRGSPLKDNPPLVPFNYSAYLFHFFRSLPIFINCKALDAGEIQEILSDSSHFYGRAYRLATLRGQPHIEDAKHDSASDRILRLYLWTWRILIGEERPNYTELVNTLDDLFSRYVNTAPTGFDGLILESSLCWIRFLTNSALHENHTISEALRSAVPFSLTSPFVLENWVAKLFVVFQKDGPESDNYKNILQNIEEHPKYHDKSLILKSLVLLLRDPQQEGPHAMSWWGVSRLKNVLQDSIRRRRDEGTDALILEPSLFRISRHGQDLINEPLSRALHFLMTERTVSASQFVRVSFGYSQYDPFIHAPKISSLLTRARTLLKPTTTLTFKGSIIRISGDLSYIQIKSDENGAAQLKKELLSRDLGLNKLQVLKANRSAQAPGLGWVSLLESGTPYKRAQIQALTRSTRITTLRRIEQALSNRLLVRLGEGKNTYYIKVSNYSEKKEKPLRGDHE